MPEFNEMAARFLGQKSPVPPKPDAKLLQALPRKLARASYAIRGDEFVGYDVWHAYEASFLVAKGLPLSGMLKIVYAASSPNIVESKSLKLYLNAFDMQIMGESMQEGIANYETRIARDLANCVGAEVRVKWFAYAEARHEVAWQNWLSTYQNLYSELGDKLIELDWRSLNSHTNYLSWQEQRGSYSQAFYTDILRSNCRITKQKDSGYAFFSLHCEGGYIVPESLLKNIISLREAEEFHEFCAEKLFVELLQCPYLRHASVILLFTRRGAIDINPVRATEPSLIPDSLINAELHSPRTPMQ